MISYQKKYTAAFIFGLGCWLCLTPRSNGQEIQVSDTISRTYTFRPIEIKSNTNTLQYPVSKIDREIILQSAGLTFDPILQQIPGIWMQSGAPNTNRISIRGVGNRVPFATSKLKVYLDEIPLTNGIGESSVEDIDPFLYQSIEIWKSPASALWGSGLGGMIQLTPAWGDSKKIRLSSQIGSFGHLNNRGLFHLKYGPASKHHTILHGQIAHQDGYRANNAYTKKAATLMHQVKISPRLRLHLFSHIIRLNAQIPSSLSFTDYKANPGKAASNWAAVKGGELYTKSISGLNLRSILSDRWSLQTSLFVHHYHSDEIRPFNILDDRSSSFGGRQRVIFSLNQTNYLSAGLELSREEYDWQTFEVREQGLIGQMLSDQSEQRNQQHFFFQYGAQLLPNLASVIGISYTRVSQSNKDQNYSQLSVNPTLGLTYTFSGSGLSLYSSLSKGVSPIALVDAISSNGTLNTELNPEKGWSFDIGTRYASKDNRFSGEISVYKMYITDLFVQKRITEDQFIGANAGKTIHNGIEIALRWNPLQTIFLTSAYTFSDHRFDLFIDENNDYSGNALTGSAPIMMNHRLELKIYEKGNLELSHRYISKTPITDNNDIYGDGFHIVDLSIQTFFQIQKSSQVRFKLGIKNIFNAAYASMYQINAQAFGNNEPRFYYPGLPRNYFLQVSYDLE